MGVEKTKEISMRRKEGNVLNMDWMLRALQSTVMQRLPKPKLRIMLERLEEVPVTSGQQIVKQGDEGDYYYIIRRGRGEVTRDFLSRRGVTIAYLSVGDTFGEEALLSGGERNATVTMETDGLLMRLSKSDFDQLLKEPLLNELAPAQVKRMVLDGAVLLDVRTEWEHKEKRIKGSINLPLGNLRDQADQLRPGKVYICYCNTDKWSSVASYLLSERGFESYVLKGGMDALRSSIARHPQPRVEPIPRNGAVRAASAHVGAY